MEYTIKLESASRFNVNIYCNYPDNGKSRVCNGICHECDYCVAELKAKDFISLLDIVEYNTI